MITNRALRRSAAALIEMRPKTKCVKKHEIGTKENIPVVRTEKIRLVVYLHLIKWHNVFNRITECDHPSFLSTFERQLLCIPLGTVIGRPGRARENYLTSF